VHRASFLRASGRLPSPLACGPYLHASYASGWQVLHVSAPRVSAGAAAPGKSASKKRRERLTWRLGWNSLQLVVARGSSPLT